ncbi:NIF family HAD-type phosphatase [Methylophaga pinxianii]|uniref:NIF family HAD-type phosphatase n=1 Tax=Methylophaga pinxianii TaxID=2881052 RepID=UPI001CF58EBD|nr:NIF family HAD-type phosphatase [Methylophaga pinxianii]MCB2425402.1 HAD family hydrolase [Methylophaga pinxianii]UPH46171.1 HAD family hydrolase [Methylophaga pinxianii]
MTDTILALDLEGVLVTNAISQFPRPGLMQFLCQCESLFGQDNICIFTSVREEKFKEIANTLVRENLVPDWFTKLRYINWVGEHKDLRFVDEDINKVIIVDDYPPYIKQTQKHRLIEISQYLEPYSHENPDFDDKELEALLLKLKIILNHH